MKFCRPPVAVLLALGLSSASPADDGLAFNVRGPLPQPGATFTEETTMSMPEMKITYTLPDGETADAVMSMTGKEQKAVTVETAADDQITKVKTRLTKDETTTKFTIDGETETEEEIGDLSGHVIISEVVGGEDTHQLGRGEPSDEQQEALDNFSMFDEERTEIPAGQLEIGASWTVDAVTMRRYLGDDVTALSGSLKSKFVGIRIYEGEPCAIIETTGKVKGKQKFDERLANVVLDFQKSTEYRSLKRGMPVFQDLEITFTLDGEVEFGELKIGIHGEGTMSGTYTLTPLP